MKVLSIGTDRKLFEEGSAVLQRQVEYAEKMEELHLIVFTLQNLNFKDIHVGNLHIYPTNSSSKFGCIFDAIRIGKKIAQENKFTKNELVITAQDPSECGFVGYKLKKAMNAPLQIQIHTDFLSPYFKNSFLSRVRVKLAKFIIPRADGLRVVSGVIVESLAREFPRLKPKIEILPIFVDMNKIIDAVSQKNVKTDFPQFDFVIVMASRLAQEKRIDIALGAFKKVLAESPRAGLIVAGSGPEKSRLDAWVAELGLKEHVVFVGWQDDLISYYKTADVFLQTSEYEGYGMTLIEAGASGVPIVTTAVGIAKTDLFKNGENSFVCQVGDVNCLADSIINLINNPEKRKLFKEKMQDNIKSISISREEYVEKYVHLLQSLL